MFQIVIHAAEGLGRDCLVALLRGSPRVVVVAAEAEPAALCDAAAGALADAVLVVGDRDGGAAIPAPECLRALWPAAELLLGSYDPAVVRPAGPPPGYQRVIHLSGSADAITTALLGAPASPACTGPAGDGPAHHANLTRRETEVLRHLAAGLAARESADQLGLSPRTIDGHRRRISSKLGVGSTAGLTRFAIAAGLVDPRAGVVGSASAGR